MDWAEVFTSTDAQAEFEMLEMTWECAWLPEASTLLITLPGSGQLCRATVAAVVADYPAQKPRIEVHASRNLSDAQVRAILSAAQAGAIEALDTAMEGFDPPVVFSAVAAAADAVLSAAPTCLVCWTELTDGSAVSASCEHAFHHTCLASWIQASHDRAAASSAAQAAAEAAGTRMHSAEHAAAAAARKAEAAATAAAVAAQVAGTCKLAATAAHDEPGCVTLPGGHTPAQPRQAPPATLGKEWHQVWQVLANGLVQPDVPSKRRDAGGPREAPARVWDMPSVERGMQALLPGLKSAAKRAAAAASAAAAAAADAEAAVLHMQAEAAADAAEQPPVPCPCCRVPLDDSTVAQACAHAGHAGTDTGAQVDVLHDAALLAWRHSLRAAWLPHLRAQLQHGGIVHEAELDMSQLAATIDSLE